MAEKGWITQVTAAAGVAAGMGAAQLGLGYGLGVVVWPVTATVDDTVWLGSLGWATWIAASSTVFGAMVGSGRSTSVIPAPPGRFPARHAGPWRFALSTAAAIGALLTVVLIALPARTAVRPDTFAPQVIAGGYALVGVLLGLVIAYWAVVSRPVAANLIATATWLWSLAIAAVVVELTLHRSSATYLTSLQFADPDNAVRHGTIYWPSSVLTLFAALIIGIIAAWPAVRRGNLGIGAASSGAVGPLLVAAAFFVLAPQLTGALGPLESAYLVAPFAVLTGLAGSALTVAIGQRAVERRARRRVAPVRRRRLAKATGVAAVPPASVAGNATGSTAAEVSPPAKTSRTRRGGRAAAKAASQASPPVRPDSPTASPTQASPTPASPIQAAPTPASPTPVGPTQASPRPAEQHSADRAKARPPADAAPVHSAADAAPRERSAVAAASTASPRPEVRSTVAPPPASPPVAKINTPRAVDAEAAGPASTRQPRKKATPAAARPPAKSPGPRREEATGPADPATPSTAPAPAPAAGALGRTATKKVRPDAANGSDATGEKGPA